MSMKARSNFYFAPFHHLPPYAASLVEWIKYATAQTEVAYYHRVLSVSVCCFLDIWMRNAVLTYAVAEYH